MADPFLDQMTAMFTSQSAADAATRKASVNRALVDFGAVPNFGAFGFSSPYLSDIDPNTAALAAGNTASGLSVMGRLNKQHTDTMRRIPDVLASRGILQSGELGHQMGEENLRSQQATYDASKQLVDFLSGAMSVFQGNEQQRSMGLLQAQQESAFRAQEIQFRQQQMAQEAALAQQSMAMANSGGGDSGGGFDFGSMFGGGDTGGGGGSPAPNQQQLQAMAAGAQQAARHRSPEVQQLFGEFAGWRNENPNWWR